MWGTQHLLTCVALVGLILTACPEVVTPVSECSADADCTDAGACRSATCTNGVCEYTLNAEWCWIDESCQAHATSSPVDPCLVCDTTTDVNAWTPKTCELGGVCVSATGGCAEPADSPIARSCFAMAYCSIERVANCSDPLGDCIAQARASCEPADAGEEALARLDTVLACHRECYELVDSTTNADFWMCLSSQCVGPWIPCMTGEVYGADQCEAIFTCATECTDGLACVRSCYQKGSFDEVGNALDLYFCSVATCKEPDISTASPLCVASPVKHGGCPAQLQACGF